MHLLFRGKLSPVAIAILTAEILLLSGCNNGNSGKSSFWRMPVNEETSDTDPWAEDEELSKEQLYDQKVNKNNSRSNTYINQQPFSTPEKK